MDLRKRTFQPPPPANEIRAKLQLSKTAFAGLKRVLAFQIAKLMAEQQMDARFMSLEEWEAERLQDPEFVAALAAREPAYQIARLRILRGLTQKQLAELVGAKQSSITRLERGATPPNLSCLSKVAAALGARVEVHLALTDDVLSPSS